MISDNYVNQYIIINSIVDITLPNRAHQRDTMPDAMNWRYFLGATILAAGLLFKAGAPLLPVAIGAGAAALLIWRRHPRA